MLLVGNTIAKTKESHSLRRRCRSGCVACAQDPLTQKVGFGALRLGKDLAEVLFVSMVQVRRTLVPLEKLQEGTQKIDARQFGSRVEVHSGDEFEELAASFNSMASQLGRQFHTLKTINEIDQAIFASLDREAIFDSVLTRMPSLLPSPCFGFACSIKGGPQAGFDFAR
jgi:HAMP domain-containing protein